MRRVSTAKDRKYATYLAISKNYIEKALKPAIRKSETGALMIGPSNILEQSGKSTPNMANTAQSNALDTHLKDLDQIESGEDSCSQCIRLLFSSRLVPNDGSPIVNQVTSWSPPSLPPHSPLSDAKSDDMGGKDSVTLFACCHLPDSYLPVKNGKCSTFKNGVASSPSPVGVFSPVDRPSSSIIWTEKPLAMFTTKDCGKDGWSSYPGLHPMDVARVRLAMKLARDNANIASWTPIATSVLPKGTLQTLKTMLNNDCKDDDADGKQLKLSVWRMLPYVVRYMREIKCMWSGRTVAYAVYEFASMIQHACPPAANAYFRFAKDGTVSVRLLRSLKEGEQVYVSYTEAVTWLPDAFDRRQLLWPHLHATCQCIACAHVKGGGDFWNTPSLPPLPCEGKGENEDGNGDEGDGDAGDGDGSGAFFADYVRSLSVQSKFDEVSQEWKRESSRSPGFNEEGYPNDWDDDSPLYRYHAASLFRAVDSPMNRLIGVARFSTLRPDMVRSASLKNIILYSDMAYELWRGVTFVDEFKHVNSNCKQKVAEFFDLMYDLLVQESNVNGAKKEPEKGEGAMYPLTPFRHAKFPHILRAMCLPILAARALFSIKMLKGKGKSKGREGSIKLTRKIGKTKTLWDFVRILVLYAALWGVEDCLLCYDYLPTEKRAASFVGTCVSIYCKVKTHETLHSS